MQTGAARAHSEARLRNGNTDAGVQLFQPCLQFGAAEGVQELDAVAVDQVVIGFPILGTLDHLKFGELEQVSADGFELFAHVGPGFVIGVQGPLHHFGHGRGKDGGRGLGYAFEAHPLGGLVVYPRHGRRGRGNAQPLSLVIKPLCHLVETGEGSKAHRTLPQVTQPLNGRGRQRRLDGLVLGIEAGDGLQEGTLLG
ncbi:hypothetical protein [Aeromonas salmonicida]|uniref:hypothetical protein n=1 Tax=Aeromonas salmonicida TaxID=645 RepID=UPI0023F538B3|nr:hypothetical protein [Aeromonas salmonicida]